jgi:hypothetical protein
MKIYCDICNKDFTREWNLKRHKSDVHELVENEKNDNLNQEFKGDFNHVPYNNPSAYPFHYEYNNIQSFPNSHIKPHISETRTFSLEDKLRIQKKLKNLENILIKGWPKFIVLNRIKMLKKQCYDVQSDEPLKRYLEKSN